MEYLFLLALSLTPGIGFLVYIMHMDKKEPEPIGLILKVMMLGALGFVPAAVFEMLLGILPVFSVGGFAGAAYVSFIQVAPVEELCKLGVVLLFVWKNKNFNEENDGIVYTGASALGFAMLENVFYVLQGGFGTGIMRALTAMPLHTFTGVIMGYFVGLGRFAPDRGAAGSLVARGFLIAWLVHGIYDFFILTGTALGLLIIPMVIALFIFGALCLRKGRARSISRWGAAAPLPGEAPAGGQPVYQAAEEGLDDGTPPSGKAHDTGGDGYQAENKETVPPRGTPPHRRHKWKAAVSRAFLTLSACFWALALLGFHNQRPGQRSGLDELIMGCVVITFIPVLAGVMLEVSYRREKRREEEAIKL